ncbi:transcription antiterminator [Caloramator sp. E03]|nr:transcription antiterminator [Caloramator sp. E03]
MYINSLDKSNGDIIISHNKNGYMINNCKNINNLIMQDDVNIPDVPDERLKYILKKLLFCKNNIDIFDLADEINVSESTIENDIKKIREMIKKYGSNIKVIKNSSYIYLQGLEKDKRKLLSDILFNETNGDFLNIEKYKRYFKDIDLNIIKSHLNKLLKKYEYTINEMTIINLIVHIAITVDRIKKHNILDMYYTSNDILNTIEYKIACDLCDKLEENFFIEIPPREKLYISHLIFSKKIFKNIYSNKYELEKNIEPYFIIITEYLIDSLCREFSIELQNDHLLFSGLCFHIKAMYQRIKHDSTLKNPILNDLKRKYPYIFDITVFLANEFYKLTDLKMDENEMGYFALHIGAALERIKEKQNKKRKVALVCSSGHITSNVLYSKIKSIYSNRVEIEGLFSFLEIDLIKGKKPDLILSTVPFEHNLQIDTIVISPFLNDMDIKKINSILDKEINNKKNLFQDVAQFFKEDIFFKDIRFKNEFEAIYFMANKLFEKGYVPKSYINNVIEREKLSSTSLGNLTAIPHPILMDAFETVISTAILNKPLEWGCHKVQLILMFAIKSGDRTKLNDLFEHLLYIIDNVEGVNYLLESKNFNDFKLRLLNYESNYMK